MLPREPCPIGYEIISRDRCQEAYGQAHLLYLTPNRSLQTGSWDGVPHQCSFQAGFDDSFHWSSNKSANNARFDTGEFVRICEAGIIRFLIPFKSPFFNFLFHIDIY